VQPLGRPAVGDDALDGRDGRPDRFHLRLGLPATADHAEAGGAGAGEVLRRDAARRSRPPLAGRVRLQHGRELARRGVEERHGEDRLPGGDRVGLDAGVAELAVDGVHGGEHAVVKRKPPPGDVVDPARRHPPEALLQDRHRLAGRDQAGDVGLGQVERQVRKPTRRPSAGS
jgi:hypothetical protein